MIRTKTDQSTTPDDAPKQLPFEEAAVKGKIYNPITGRELANIIGFRISTMLQDNGIDMAYAQSTQLAVERELLKHPSFDTDVKAYPKADVAISLALGPGPLLGNTTRPAARYLINIAVAQFPQEEKRGMAVSIDYISGQQSWEREPLTLELKWNLDSIPPDATRILADLPVPTPARTPGSGPSGEATITDEAKPASEKQREAVVKQFGNAKRQEPLTSKGEQKK